MKNPVWSRDRWKDFVAHFHQLQHAFDIYHKNFPRTKTYTPFYEEKFVEVHEQFHATIAYIETVYIRQHSKESAAFIHSPEIIERRQPRTDWDSLMGLLDFMKTDAIRLAEQFSIPARKEEYKKFYRLIYRFENLKLNLEKMRNELSP